MKTKHPFVGVIALICVQGTIVGVNSSSFSSLSSLKSSMLTGSNLIANDSANGVAVNNITEM